MAENLEDRVAVLEQQVAHLRRQQSKPTNGREWLDDLYGRFADDPIFARAMKLGRNYRQSLRPRSRKGVSRR